jgi:predicted lipoprotein with Yx(FWY)xxD motif
MRAVRATVVLALAALALAAVAGAAVPTFPAKTIKVKGFGTVLAGANRVPLYTWDKERDHKVHCTGACAKAWPPLVVPANEMAMVHPHVAGVAGKFAIIHRPDGKAQLTLNGKPLYSFSGDAPGQVKCDGVDGWHVVRV